MLYCSTKRVISTFLYKTTLASTARDTRYRNTRMYIGIIHLRLAARLFHIVRYVCGGCGPPFFRDSPRLPSKAPFFATVNEPRRDRSGVSRPIGYMYVRQSITKQDQGVREVGALHILVQQYTGIVNNISPCVPSADRQVGLLSSQRIPSWCNNDECLYFVWCTSIVIDRLV